MKMTTSLGFQHSQEAKLLCINDSHVRKETENEGISRKLNIRKYTVLMKLLSDFRMCQGFNSNMVLL